jgi:hypothetical protein
MKRLHLFEFMDLKWYPDLLRRPQTNILQALMVKSNAFDYAAPYIDDVLQKLGSSKIIDLCSGASGPWLRLIKKLEHPHVQVILTDKYPNLAMFAVAKMQTQGQIDFIETPVDALRVPASLTGVRIIFTAFHHFRPPEVRQILSDAQENKQAILIFDNVPDKKLTIALFPLTFIVSFFQFYLLSFLVRPLTIEQILFTNVLPIVPFVSAWDGFVSALRKYDASQLTEITSKLSTPVYQWRVGADYNLSKATPLTYLIGLPLI